MGCARPLLRRLRLPFRHFPARELPPIREGPQERLPLAIAAQQIVSRTLGAGRERQRDQRVDVVALNVDVRNRSSHPHYRERTVLRSFDELDAAGALHDPRLAVDRNRGKFLRTLR